jgi:hypothetical protein
MVLRTDLAEGMPEALPAADPARGTSGVECPPPGVGRADGLEGVFMRDGVAGRLLRGGLAGGTGGSADVGGSAVGRDNTGSDVDMAG